MSQGVLLVLMALGGGAIALWFDWRFPSLEPRGVIQLVALVAAIRIVGKITVPTAIGWAGESQSHLLLAVFGVAFPVLVGNLLLGFWVLKLVQRTFAGHLR